MGSASWNVVARATFAILRIAAVMTFVWDSAHAQTGQHRWGGLVEDVFVMQTSAGVKAWTVEDGGRIRYRDPATGQWSFQAVPSNVQDTLRGVQFLVDGPQAGLKGWAVGSNGWVLGTSNGGSTWSVLTRLAVPNVPGQVWDELYDIHFVNANEGWAIGERTFAITDDGGAHWTSLNVLGIGGWPAAAGATSYTGYGLDIVERADGSRMGLAVLRPGLVLRSTASNPTVTDLVNWNVVWDVSTFCASPCGQVLSGCECDVCPVSHGTWLDPWDVEISRKPGQPFALFVGGIGVQCGLILSSADDGVTWSKEYHECACAPLVPPPPPCLSCDGSPLYNPLPGDPSHIYRHKSFKTLYGVAIQDGDNSAVAVGYNGQYVLRDPATGVWRDRTAFNTSVPATPGSVTFPQIGVDALAGVSGAGFVISCGEGGYLRESTDGGNTWVNKAVGEPHRIKDVHFLDIDEGWQVGQFFRIARTINGGLDWSAQSPDPDKNLGNCRAISFAGDGSVGVAVGDPFTPEPGPTKPKIRFLPPGFSTWQEDVNIVGSPTFIDGKGLREVTWVSGQQFWAVGSGGLMLNSTNGGQTWRLFFPTGESGLSLFLIEGVAFMDASTGLFVGKRPNPSPSGPIRGAIYQLRDVAGTVTWTAPLILTPVGSEITRLEDVDIANGVAWVVGEKDVGGNPEGGIVLTSFFAGSSFGQFAEVSGPPNGFPLCTAGNADEDDDSVLSEVEVGANGTIWVGGLCGRVWVRSTSGSWTEVKSQTDAHIVGMSLVPSGSATAAYVAGFRNNETQQCVVRLQ